MKRSKGGGNEIKWNPCWIQLCALNPSEAKRLGLKQPGVGAALSSGCVLAMAAPVIPPHKWTAAGKLRASQTNFPQSPVVSVPSKYPNANLTSNPLKWWDMMSSGAWARIASQEGSEVSPRFSHFPSPQGGKWGSQKAQLTTGIGFWGVMGLWAPGIQAPDNPLSWPEYLVIAELRKDPRVTGCFPS